MAMVENIVKYKKHLTKYHLFSIQIESSISFIAKSYKLINGVNTLYRFFLLKYIYSQDGSGVSTS